MLPFWYPSWPSQAEKRLHLSNSQYPDDLQTFLSTQLLSYITFPLFCFCMATCVIRNEKVMALPLSVWQTWSFITTWTLWIYSLFDTASKWRRWHLETWRASMIWYKQERRRCQETSPVKCSLSLRMTAGSLPAASSRPREIDEGSRTVRWWWHVGIRSSGQSVSSLYIY